MRELRIYTRGSLIACVVCGAVVAVHPLSAKAPVPPELVTPEVVKAVQGVLPKGWTASVKGTTITARREKKVGFNLAVGLDAFEGPPPTPDYVQTYEISLQFRPRMTAEKYDKMRKENDEIDKKLDAMRDKLRAAQISHKFDDWLPSTPEQKKLVAEYRAMQKAMSYHRLPDLYNDASSIDLADSVDPFLGFASGEEAKECQGVKEAICKLYKSHAEQWQRAVTDCGVRLLIVRPKF